MLHIYFISFHLKIKIKQNNSYWYSSLIYLFKSSKYEKKIINETQIFNLIYSSPFHKSAHSEMCDLKKIAHLNSKEVHMHSFFLD